MRLVIARCSVDYDGRLTAHLPSALRLLIVKADGSVLVHSDGGSYKPLNWMSPPCRLTEHPAAEEQPGRWTVTNKAGETLTISIEEKLSDTSVELGVDPGLVKDGVEAHLQELLAEQLHLLGDGWRLIRREYPTPIGPVDIMCRDDTGEHVAVEMKRHAGIDAVEQLTRYLELLNRDPLLTPVRGVLAAQTIKLQARTLAEDRGIRCVVLDYDAMRGIEREGTLFLSPGGMIPGRPRRVSPGGMIPPGTPQYFPRGNDPPGDPPNHGGVPPPLPPRRGLRPRDGACGAAYVVKGLRWLVRCFPLGVQCARLGVHCVPAGAAPKQPPPPGGLLVPLVVRGDWLAVLLLCVVRVVAGVVLLAVLLVVEVACLLLGLVLELLAVQVVVVALFQVLVELRGREAGQQFLAQLVVLGDALGLAVVLVHAHGLEARRTGQQLVRHLVRRPLVAVDLVVGALGAEHVKESHEPQRSRARGPPTCDARLSLINVLYRLMG